METPKRNPEFEEEKPADTPPPASTGFPPGSVGDVSARVGYDVRDLLMMGYSHDQISDVAAGRMSLEELLQSKPAGR